MGAKFHHTLRIQGAMLLVLAVSMLIPLLIALYTRENSSGKAFATVTRAHNSKEFVRDYNGTQDVFQFQL